MSDTPTSIPENQEAEKLFTQSELENKIKDRLKNKSAENEDLRQRLARIEEEHAQMQQAMQASPPEQSPQMPMDQGAHQMMPQGQPPQTPQGLDQVPLTAESMQSLLNAHEQRMQEENKKQEAQKAYDYYMKTANDLISNDPKFKELVEKTANEGKYGLPLEVSVKIANALSPDKAKDVYTELMSNENSHIKMENARLKGDDSFNQWLSKIVANSKMDEKKPPADMPDLSESDITDKNYHHDDNVTDYIKNSMY